MTLDTRTKRHDYMEQQYKSMQEQYDQLYELAKKSDPKLAVALAHNAHTHAAALWTTITLERDFPILGNPLLEDLAYEVMQLKDKLKKSDGRIAFIQELARTPSVELIPLLAEMFNSCELGLAHWNNDNGADEYQCHTCGDAKRVKGSASGNEHVSEVKHHPGCQLFKLYEITKKLCPQEVDMR